MGHLDRGGKALVALRDHEVTVEHHDPHRRLLEEHVQALTLAQCRQRRRHAFAYVVQHEDVAVGARRGALAGDGDLEVPLAAVGCEHGRLEAPLLGGIQV